VPAFFRHLQSIENLHVSLRDLQIPVVLHLQEFEVKNPKGPGGNWFQLVERKDKIASHRGFRFVVKRQVESTPGVFLRGLLREDRKKIVKVRQLAEDYFVTREFDLSFFRREKVELDVCKNTLFQIYSKSMY